MDKKNTVLGLLFLMAAFSLFFWQARQMQEYEEAMEAERARQEQIQKEEAGSKDVLPEPVGGETDAGPDPEPIGGMPVEEAGEVLAPVPEAALDPAAIERIVLTNERIRVTFTNLGAGIEKVEFLTEETESGIDPYIFNAQDEVPSHALEFPGRNGGLIPFLPAFEVVDHTAERVSFRYVDARGMVFTRTYRLAESGAGQDPYVLNQDLLIENQSGEAVTLPLTYLRMGTTGSLAFDRMSVGEYLNISYYDGNRMRYLKGRKFIGSNGFFGFWSKEPVPDFRQSIPLETLSWAGIKNQFFVGIVRENGVDSALDSRAENIVIKASELEGMTGPIWKQLGITGSIGYRLGDLQAGETATLGTEFYIGPKEFIRLQALGQNEEKLMQYWGPDFISQAMTLLMHGIHKVVPSWGLAIIILTLSIKLFFWPFTSRGMRAQKLNAVKMQPLQDEMKRLNERYKDNPQARQKAMMDLYKKHDINPAAMMGGCLPMLVQIPIFIGLYGMLRVAPEFRFSSLLWIDQLAYPDTVAMLGGFPLNLLPLVYGAVVYFQMRMTPMPETADETQQLTFKMMRFLPLMLVIWLYNFAAALFVYFTTNALLTMLQQFLINRKLQPEIDALKAEVERKQGGGGPESAVAGPAPWEKKAKPKDKKTEKPAQKFDGLGSTRKLSKGGGGRNRRKKKK